MRTWTRSKDAYFACGGEFLVGNLDEAIVAMVDR